MNLVWLIQKAEQWVTEESAYWIDASVLVQECQSGEQHRWEGAVCSCSCFNTTFPAHFAVESIHVKAFKFF